MGDTLTLHGVMRITLQGLAVARYKAYPRPTLAGYEEGVWDKFMEGNNAGRYAGTQYYTWAEERGN